MLDLSFNAPTQLGCIRFRRFFNGFYFASHRIPILPFFNTAWHRILSIIFIFSCGMHQFDLAPVATAWSSSNKFMLNLYYIIYAFNILIFLFIDVFLYFYYLIMFFAFTLLISFFIFWPVILTTWMYSIMSRWQKFQ